MRSRSRERDDLAICSHTRTHVTLASVYPALGRTSWFDRSEFLSRPPTILQPPVYDISRITGYRLLLLLSPTLLSTDGDSCREHSRQYRRTGCSGSDGYGTWNLSAKVLTSISFIEDGAHRTGKSSRRKRAF